MIPHDKTRKIVAMLCCTASLVAFNASCSRDTQAAPPRPK
jgi:hypothetical protein